MSSSATHDKSTACVACPLATDGVCYTHEVERLKATVKSLRRRLRAVKQYYSIKDSDIAKVIRLGYGS